MDAFIKIRFFESIACKNKGMKIAEVPDEDLAYTVRHYLGQSLQEPEYDSGI